MSGLYLLDRVEHTCILPFSFIDFPFDQTEEAGDAEPAAMLSRCWPRRRTITCVFGDVKGLSQCQESCLLLPPESKTQCTNLVFWSPESGPAKFHERGKRCWPNPCLWNSWTIAKHLTKSPQPGLHRNKTTSAPLTVPKQSPPGRTGNLQRIC